MTAPSEQEWREAIKAAHRLIAEFRPDDEKAAELVLTLLWPLRAREMQSTLRDYSAELLAIAEQVRRQHAAGGVS